MSALSPLDHRRVAGAVVTVALLVLALASTARAGQTAPGAPGQPATWTPANKDGFGTAATTSSHVWYTLGNGELTEVYYPNLGTPSVRDLQLIVSDGKTFAERETDSTTHVVQLADSRSLTYRQIDTETAGRYQITKTYVTDPAGNALLVNIHFRSLTGKPYKVYALYDPSLNNNGNDDSGASRDGRLVAFDGTVASAMIARPAFGKTSTGYLGTSDGWTDLRSDYRMNWHYSSATNGNIVQTARTALNGTTSQHLVLSLGFGGSPRDASRAAWRALSSGPRTVSSAYESGWHHYLEGLKPQPASVSAYPTTYDVSAMVLAASEDKTYRGAYIASPTMPWVWGTGLENPSGAYHLVWARDLYEIATALIADGDRAGAQRALNYLFDRQQKPDGSFPQNSTVTERPTGRTPSSTRSPTRSCSPGSSAVRRHRLLPREEGGRLPRRQRPEHAAGALGEPGRLVAGDDRGRDRRPGVRGRHRAAKRRQCVRRQVPVLPPTCGSTTSRAGPPRPPARTRARRTTCA